MKKMILLLLAIAFTSCWDGSFDFETMATYQANASHLKVDLTAIGHVQPGHDLGDGQVKAKIYSSKFSDTIYLEASPILLTLLKYKNDTIEISKPYDIAASLMHCLAIIGHLDYDEEELKEFGEAIELTAYGPKTTYMKNQTKFIKVLSVDYRTY